MHTCVPIRSIVGYGTGALRDLWDWSITYYYRKISNIRSNKSQHLNDSRLVLQMSLPNPFKPSVKWIMKMLQLHLSYQQWYCLQRCAYIRGLTVLPTTSLNSRHQNMIQRIKCNFKMHIIKQGTMLTQLFGNHSLSPWYTMGVLAIKLDNCSIFPRANIFLDCGCVCQK